MSDTRKGSQMTLGTQAVLESNENWSRWLAEMEQAAKRACPVCHMERSTTGMCDCT